MLGLISSSHYHQYKQPASIVVDRAIQDFIQRTGFTEGLVLLQWDPYNNRVNLLLPSEPVKGNRYTRARQKTMGVKVASIDELPEYIMLAIDHLLKDMYLQELEAQEDPRIEENLMKLFHGKQVMTFEDFFPLGRWPQDVYDTHFKHFQRRKK